MPDTLLPLFFKQETADCRKMTYPSLGITWWVKLLKAGLKTMRLCRQPKKGKVEILLWVGDETEV